MRMQQGNFFHHGPYQNRGRGRGGRKFFNYKPGGYRDRDYHRRYRSRSRFRDSDDRRSYSKEEDETMRKVDEAKEKINKYIADSSSKEKEVEERKTGRSRSLSEGEEVDEEEGEFTGSRDADSDYRGESKWTEKEKDSPVDEEEREKGELPENSIDEMEKFLNKVKSQKKEEMKERNKAFMKPTPW